MDVLAVFAAGVATTLATGLGAIPVWVLGVRAEALRPLLWGVAAGVMVVASVVGLLMPAVDEGRATEVGGGLAAGVAFLLVARTLLGAPRKATLVVVVLFVHSLPEGFAIGTAWASDAAGLSTFVVLAIAIQNIPEGTVTAIGLEQAGASRARQFWAAVLTSLPQPIGAVIALLLVEEVTALLPVSFAFAAGAMLALTVHDLLPEARTRLGAVGFVAGAALMVGCAELFGV